MSRFTLRAAVPIALIVLASMTIVAHRWQQDHVTNSGAASRDVKISTVFGIADPGLINETRKKQISDLAEMKSIGITSVRIDANWAWVQPKGPRTFDWKALDREVKDIRAVGMSADLIIDGCPRWAALPSARKYVYSQPASAAQYATWAADVARRYASEDVNYFEIWNEPNNIAFWHPRPDPAAYAADLVAAYATVKAADPSAFVISAGLSPASSNGINYSPASFLEEMYEDGAKGSFDAVGVHPYSYPSFPDIYQPWSTWSQMSQTSPSVRSVMVDHGDSSKQIWITEFGAESIGPRSIGTTGQSVELSQALSYVRQVSWIGSLYIYTWQDLPTVSPSNNGYGLLTVNGSRKPAFYTVDSALTGSRRSK
jgi:hypothetical protein